MVNSCVAIYLFSFSVTLSNDFSFLNYLDRFPSKLRSMCHCLYHVVNQRFQQSTGEAVWTVIGTVIFLRFINPAIGNLCRPVYVVFLSTSLCIMWFSFIFLFMGVCGVNFALDWFFFYFSLLICSLLIGAKNLDQSKVRLN